MSTSNKIDKISPQAIREQQQKEINKPYRNEITTTEQEVINHIQRNIHDAIELIETATELRDGLEYKTEARKRANEVFLKLGDCL